MIALLVPGGLFALAAALLATAVGKRFPQISNRLHLSSVPARRRSSAAPAPLAHA
jgi:hypothetical protein